MWSLHVLPVSAWVSSAIKNMFASPVSATGTDLELVPRGSLEGGLNAEDKIPLPVTFTPVPTAARLVCGYFLLCLHSVRANSIRQMKVKSDGNLYQSRKKSLGGVSKTSFSGGA